MEARNILDISSFLYDIGVLPVLVAWINIAFGLGVIIILAWISDFITRKLLIKIISKLAGRTAMTFDDALVEKRFFHRLAHLVPAIIIYYSIGLVLAHYPKLLAFLRSGINVYMIIMVVMVINAFINAANAVYQTMEIAKSRSIKGYIQVIRIIIYFVAAIFILSIILHKNPSGLFAGLGAMAAVLLLVFKDTILGLVASVQLSANDMVRVGDWITMPSRDADGNVLEITLNTVKVQNFDKTISTIPTYSLVSESFSNWRGMEESGGRRIVRSIKIDMKSVKFCSAEMIEKFKKISLLKEYIERKQAEFNDYNKKLGIDESVMVNGRRLTNLGAFRKYLIEYLRQNQRIRKDMTLLVKLSQPSETGIPIEIVVFSKEIKSPEYENLQAEIFDHVLAVLPEFGLGVYQSPSGSDFAKVMAG